ncbi:MAG: response regulator transcription factor [Ardenticatenaceae bacterium]|nr:response regulator transcription factor [Ardenticatenaceae bacterium]MCB9444134.1 response regulator transcription factor [Ardenticatenaceae bacterium]
MKSANGRYTTTQRVLVIDNDSIMGAGVETLLANSEKLQVIGTAPQNEDDIVHDVWQFSPDVIILNYQSQLTTPVRLLSLLNNYRSFRLIVVSEDDNMMEVYEKRQFTARHHSDLATAVQWN